MSTGSPLDRGSDGFERVHTMTDFYDVPRGGVASFRGGPHDYRCPLEVAFDDLIYELRPIDDETLQLALEDWEIWLRWLAAYEANLTGIDSHPALPADRARHDAIAAILDARLAALPDPPILARAEFRGSPDTNSWFEARWTVVD